MKTSGPDQGIDDGPSVSAGAVDMPTTIASPGMMSFAHGAGPHGEASAARSAQAVNAALNHEAKTTVETDLLAACHELDVPVRVVHGLADPRPLWAVTPMAEALPRAELVVLEGVGHLSWLEDPAAFASATCDFVTTSMPDMPGRDADDDGTDR